MTEDLNEVEVECPECNGTGYIFVGINHLDEDDYEECTHCLGYGYILEEV